MCFVPPPLPESSPFFTQHCQKAKYPQPAALIMLMILVDIPFAQPCHMPLQVVCWYHNKKNRIFI